jgi:hypothetical protein
VKEVIDMENILELQSLEEDLPTSGLATPSGCTSRNTSEWC